MVSLPKPIPSIRDLRLRAGLSQGQLARACHMSRESIAEAEAGRRPRWSLRMHVYHLWLAYLRRDPLHGWLKAALLLDPDGDLPVGALEYRRRKPRKPAAAASVF